MLLDQTITQGADTVGYMLFNDHIATAEKELVDAINRLQAAGVDDLILDIRYNGGGYPRHRQRAGLHDRRRRTRHVRDAWCSTTRIRTRNPVMDAAADADAVPHDHAGLQPPPGQPLPTLNLNRVYVITGPNTCSASEAIINGLRGVGVQVFQIGSTTCGKPYRLLSAGQLRHDVFLDPVPGPERDGLRRLPGRLRAEEPERRAAA